MAGGVPSHDAFAERVVISAAVLDPGSIPEIARYVGPDDFYLPLCREVWRAVVALDAASREVAADAVAAWLHEQGKLEQIGGLPAIAEVLEASPAISAAHEYARSVAERAAIRRTGSVAVRVAAEARSSVADPRAWLQDVEARVSEATDTSRIAERDPAATARQVAKEVHDGLLERFAKVKAGEDGAPGLSTGFCGLDYRIGRLLPGTMTVLGAGTGVGKTGLALSIARNVARSGAGVVYATLEIPREELLERAVADCARIPCDDLFAGRIDDADQSIITMALAELAKLPLVIDDATAHSIATLRGLVRRAASKLGLRVQLLVVDYLQRVRAATTQRNASDVDRITAASMGLLDLAKDLNVAVLAPAQFNRDYKNRSDKEPQVSDLHGSSQIEKDARAILLLQRVSGADEDPQVVRAFARKARGGGHLGVTDLVLRKRTATWVEAERDDPSLGRAGGWSPRGARPQPRDFREPDERDYGQGAFDDGFGGL